MNRNNALKVKEFFEDNHEIIIEDSGLVTEVKEVDDQIVYTDDSWSERPLEEVDTSEVRILKEVTDIKWEDENDEQSDDLTDPNK